MVKWETLVITPALLALISEIDEFKGAWRALGQLAPERLQSLRMVSTIESIGSSTRIEGSKLTDREVERLLTNLQLNTYATRDEQEVAGYAAVMNIVFQNYAEIPLTENYIRQLHKQLLQYSAKDEWHRGNYKTSHNHVAAFGPDGKRIGIVFETASPFETPMRMAGLVAWASAALDHKELHPLLVTALFIVELLAIHPFQDGNGRLSRVLTTFLLLRSGYAYVPYSSLEAVIEQRKEGYYLALRQTQGTLKSATPDWQPWVMYFLSALRNQKLILENKLEHEKLLQSALPELSVQILELAKLKGSVTNSDIVIITKTNRNTVKKHLEFLVARKYLEKNGTGRGTWYTIGQA